jgi:hypothetical protein
MRYVPPHVGKRSCLRQVLIDARRNKVNKVFSAGHLLKGATFRIDALAGIGATYQFLTLVEGEGVVGWLARA